MPTSQLPIPEFFVYYGKSSMDINKEVLDSLTEEDVAHLSEAERKFFAWYKAETPLSVHSGFCQGPRPSQEEECQSILEILEIFK